MFKLLDNEYDLLSSKSLCGYKPGVLMLKLTLVSRLGMKTERTLNMRL